MHIAIKKGCMEEGCMEEGCMEEGCMEEECIKRLHSDIFALTLRNIAQTNIPCKMIAFSMVADVNDLKVRKYQY